MVFVDFHSPVFWLYVLLTALVPGLLATWLGVGGCFLRIPMMMYLFGLPIKVAYCVNQMVIAITTLPGVYVHWKNKHIYARGTIVAAVSAVAGTMLGAYVVARYISPIHLRAIFGFVCVGIGIYVFWNTYRARGKLAKRVTVEEAGKLEAGVKLAALMFLAGFATGICGFGGGIYYVPVFMALGYPTHVAVGSSSAQMIFTASSGSAVLAASGFHNMLMFAVIGIPTLIASWYGAKLSRRSAPWLLRMVYAVLISAVGLYVAIDALAKIM